MINSELVKIFREMTELYEMDGVAFKPRAYENAANSIYDMSDDVFSIYAVGGFEALLKISGVGKGIAEKIEEYIKTGKIKEYAALKKKMPADISGLTAIEGVGPKAIKIFYEQLKIKNISELEKAARAGKIARLPGFGQKSQEKILKGIEFRKKSGGRFRLGDVYELAQDIKKRLAGLGGVTNFEIAGSFRRGRETVGDLDFLASYAKASGAKAAKLSDYFASMPEVTHVYAKGKTKTMVRLDNGIDADLRVVAPESFGAALQYFTGSKEHNVELRKIAIKKGWKLNEYGLFQKEKRIAGRTEKEIYEKLGLQYIPPELREADGEFGKIPILVEPEEVKGDLQLQTTWTDGTSTMEDYARECQKLGYEYIVITDHTKALAMAHGLDEKKILKQGKEIDRINSKPITHDSKFIILKGSEVDILKDGSLDIKDEVLRELDFVGASVHSYFNLSKKDQTARLIKAMENPHVDAIFHPTGRIVQKRPEIELDMDEIFEAAVRTGTMLEINAFPDRLDLKDEYVKRAKKYGVKFVINTDAHSVKHLELMHFGVKTARRGWLTKDEVINTLPQKQFLELLRKSKKERFIF